MKNKLQSVLYLAVMSVAAAGCFGTLLWAQQTTPRDEVYDLRALDPGRVTAPRPLNHPDPEYTDRARKKKISGLVLLSLVVTADGAVRDAKVITGLDKDLDRQALKVVSTWTFLPATMDGKRVAVRIPVEISFRIR
jgi:TonB family protein